MAEPLHPSFAITLGIGALILWRISARVRRMIGRQRLSRVRPYLSVVLFPVLVLVLCLVAFENPTALLGLLAGCAVGVGLGVFGLRLTRFEATPAGHFYTPNPYLGVALSVLLIARLGWRYAQLYGAGLADDGSMHLARSPLTLLIFGLLAGYYTTYSAGLLRWKHRGEPAGSDAPPG